MGYVHMRKDGAEKAWALGFIPVWIGPAFNSITARSWTPDWLMFVCDLSIPYRIQVTETKNIQRKEVIRNSWRNKHLNHINWWGIRHTIVTFLASRIYTFGIFIICAGAALDTFGFDKSFERSGTLLVMFAISCVFLTMQITSSLTGTNLVLERVNNSEVYYSKLLNEQNSDPDYKEYRLKRSSGKVTAYENPEDEKTKKKRQAIRKQQSRFATMRETHEDKAKDANDTNRQIFEDEFILAFFGTFVAGFGDTYPWEALGLAW